MNPARYPLVMVLLALLMLSALPLLSAQPPAGHPKPAAEEQPTVDVPLMGEKIRQLMQDRMYQEAVEEIDRAPLTVLAGYHAVSDLRESGVQPSELMAGATTALRRLQIEPGEERISRHIGS